MLRLITKSFSKFQPKATQPLFNQLSQTLRVQSFSSFSSLSDDTITFPREQEGLNYSLNWALAKSLVTPFNTVHRNKASSGSSDSGSSTVKIVGKEFDAKKFQSIHRAIAKKLSAAENVYVEEGELGGLHVRIVCGSEEEARQARGSLDQSSVNQNAQVTVLLGSDKDNSGLTLIDVDKRVVVTSSANKDALSQAIKNIVSK